MKKIIYIIFLIISVLSFAQKGPNPFSEEESLNVDRNEKMVLTESAFEDPGNAADPMPVDDYIPILIITAVGLIIFSQYYKRPSS